MEVKIKRLHPDARIPRYATPGSACFDLHSVNEEDSVVRHQLPVAFRTGLSFEIPKDHVMLIFSRSGHGFNNDCRLANCVGVIDSDYRGEVLVKLSSDASLGVSRLRIRQGDRIAQGMVIPVEQATFVLCDKLSDTERGNGGCGSTGA